MSLLIGKTEGSSDVAENADEKLPNRAWPNVYQSLGGLMIFMKNVLASVGSGVQNLMYSLLFLMISRGGESIWPSSGAVLSGGGRGVHGAFRHDL